MGVTIYDIMGGVVHAVGKVWTCNERLRGGRLCTTT